MMNIPRNMMRALGFSAAFACMLLTVGFRSASKTAALQEGDLIFQTSESGQSKAIQLATHSKYSHCGIVFQENNGWYVLEAVEPVKRTPLETWIKHGKDGKYTTRRLIKASEVLTPEVITAMKSEGEKLEGKHYDLTFEWSDDRIYCSELAWKIYQRATGLEIGKLQKLGEFDLSNAIVKQKLKERYGEKIPLDEKVISPGAVFDSELLTTVQSN